MTKNNTQDTNNGLLQLSKQEVALYIVATPIGNLDDITIRALKILGSVDVIACEDTRITGNLLSKIGIRTKMICYNDHSTQKDRKKIMALLQQGKSVALVSDAGTPLISDPGYKLVRDCYDKGLKVTSIAGASSVITALTLSGLPSDRFLFEGFLPAKKEARKNTLAQLKHIKAALIFFESARRLLFTLNDIAEVLGKRDIAVLREMTKKFEEVKRGQIEDISAYYKDNPPKGEIVIVVSPPVANNDSVEEITAQLGQALKNMSTKDAVAFVSENTGANRKDVYKIALDLLGGKK